MLSRVTVQKYTPALLKMGCIYTPKLKCYITPRGFITPQGVSIYQRCKIIPCKSVTECYYTAGCINI